MVNLIDYDLIIFDLDGVILNIVDAIRKAAIDGVEKFKINADPESVLAEIAALIEKINTIPIPKTILNANELLQASFLEPKYTVLKRLEIAAYIYTKYRKYQKSESDIYPGIDKLLKHLKDKGKKIDMLTNNRSVSAKETLEKYNLLQYFTNIIGYNETEKLKPEPDGLLKILEINKVKAKRALFIGDMKSDIICGNRANIKTIAVVSGLTKKEDLKEENPFMIVNNTAELAKLFGLKL